MGCLFKSFGLIIIFILLLPIILLLSFFGRVRFGRGDTTHTHHDDESASHSETHNHDNIDTSDHSDKPIDQSTVEYIDFEEVEENDKENK
jgi:hypothetical protein